MEENLLPGTRVGSILNDVHIHLLRGNVLTSLDAVFSNRTVCLNKYISVLRNKYHVDVKDQWIPLPSKKRVKQYWIEGRKEQSSAK